MNRTFADDDAAAVERFEAGDGAQQARVLGAARAEDTDRLAVSDAQVERCHYLVKLQSFDVCVRHAGCNSPGSQAVGRSWVAAIQRTDGRPRGVIQRSGLAARSSRRLQWLQPGLATAAIFTEPFTAVVEGGDASLLAAGHANDRMAFSAVFTFDELPAVPHWPTDGAPRAVRFEIDDGSHGTPYPWGELYHTRLLVTPG